MSEIVPPRGVVRVTGGPTAVPALSNTWTVRWLSVVSDVPQAAADPLLRPPAAGATPASALVVTSMTVPDPPATGVGKPSASNTDILMATVWPSLFGTSQAVMKPCSVAVTTGFVSTTPSSPGAPATVVPAAFSAVRPQPTGRVTVRH